MVGYHRYEGVAATTILAELYAALRLYVNFFQPSFKLAEKRRDGARVIKRHHAPATPCQRLLDDPRTTGAVRDRLPTVFAELDPVRSEERRVGKERASTCRSRWSPYH